MAHPHSNLVQVFDNLEINVSSLAALTGILGNSKIDGARIQGFRTLMQEGNVELDGSGTTSPAGGPIIVGFAQGELNLAEVEEALETDPASSGDVPRTEQARRQIFIFGYIQMPFSGHDGMAFMFAKKFKWSYIEGVPLNYFAYNSDLTTALPSTTEVKIHCKHVGVWLRD